MLVVGHSCLLTGPQPASASAFLCFSAAGGWGFLLLLTLRVKHKRGSLYQKNEMFESRMGLLIAGNNRWSEMQPTSFGEGRRCMYPGRSFANSWLHLLLVAMALGTGCHLGKACLGRVHISGLSDASAHSALHTLCPKLYLGLRCVGFFVHLAGCSNSMGGVDHGLWTRILQWDLWAYVRGGVCGNNMKC